MADLQDHVAREATASLREVADHLKHVREVAGPDCVGLGAGYDTGATHADGLTDVSRYPPDRRATGTGLVGVRCRGADLGKRGTRNA
jgi:microsomal dipeptidase-like Zn-dependent dipeptidase